MERLYYSAAFCGAESSPYLYRSRVDTVFSQILMTFKDRLTRAFSIDYRSLAAFRMALGFGIVVHAITFMPGMFDFFADGGLALRPPVFPNLFLISTAKWYVACVFVFEALCGLAILYNVCARIAAAFVFLVILSVTWRTPEVTYGVDMLLRMELLWFLFLPSGRPRGETATRFTSIASVGALMQIALIYVFTGLFKDAVAWLDQGTSVYQALLGYTFTTSFGHFLAQMPLSVMKIASVSVLLLERLGPILFFSPFFFSACRMIAFGSFALMHLLFVMSLHIGLFAYFDIVFLLLLLPAEFWNELGKFRVLKGIRLPSRDDVLAKFNPAVQALAAVVLAIVTFSNFYGYLDLSAYASPRFIRNLSWYGLEQRWTMFSPFPAAEAGIYIVSGTTRSGDLVNGFAADGSPPDFSLNGNWIYRLPNARWLSFLRNRYHREGLEKSLRTQFSNYFCGKWKKAHSEPLKDVSLWLTYRLVMVMPGTYASQVELLKVPCGSPPKP
jgi:hypothetical protein